MKIDKISSLIITIGIVFSMHVHAQKNFYKDAERAYKNKEYYAAIDLYKAAYKSANKDKKAEVLFKTAECYRRINDTKQAETYYSKTIKAKYPDPIATLRLADMMKANEKYPEALAEYNNYKQDMPSERAGEEGAKSCELAQQWKDNPTRYLVDNMAQINTKDWDYAPSFADKKGTTLYFSSTREGATGGQDLTVGELYADIFETKVDKNGKWSTPMIITPIINTSFNEAAPAMTKKMSALFFTRCDVKKKQNMTCQLWKVDKKGTTWGDPEKMTFCVDSFNFGHPTVSADEALLIFASDMDGSVGGLDLWYSVKDKKTKTWGEPINMGPAVNTDKDEIYPFIHEDGTLYFSSDGHLGMGGIDIFRAEKKGDKKWENVSNMKYPINSAGDDFGIIFEGKKEKGYLTSNRKGGKGGDDIYSFILPPLLYTLSGVVTEEDTKLPVENATVKLVGSDGTSFELKADKVGFYKYDVIGDKRYINRNTSYIVSASGLDVKSKDFPEGVLGNPKAKITTVGLEKATDFKQDFVLKKIKKEIKMPLVLFNLDEFDLLHISNPKDSLEFLYQTMIESPNITVELSAHTDARNSAAYNQTLSANRAKTCVEYLVKDKGIASDRISPRGFGESSPAVTEKDITLPSGKIVPKGTVLKEAFINKYKANKEDFEILHQINRRVVFEIKSKTYVPKDGPVKDNPFPEIQMNNSDVEGGESDEEAEKETETPK